MSDEDELPSLQELDKSIKEAKERAETGGNSKGSSGGAFRTSVDLVAGVAVGSFAGYYIDKWLDTKPIFFIVCFFLGVAGSALNIYRSVQRDNKDS